MRLSTSNSKRRTHWRRTWLLAALLVVALLGSYELYWRSRGFVPAISDDADLWGLARSRVRAEDPGEVVLVGASRLQLGIDPALFAEVYGRKPVQLSVDGSSCIPVLQDLSLDEHFRGLVICEVSPWTFFTGLDPVAGKQAEYVRHYEQRSASASIEQILRGWVQLHLVLRLPDVTINRMLGSLFNGKPLRPGSYIVTLPDRSRRADYTQIDTADLSRYREDRTRQAGYGIAADQFHRDLETLEAMVARIQQRGGRVVFLVMPTSGSVRQIEESRLPRARYWDVLAARTRAVTIHFADDPSLQFECPEGSHLDYRDAREFTKALAVVLKAKRL